MEGGEGGGVRGGGRRLSGGLEGQWGGGGLRWGRTDVCRTRDSPRVVIGGNSLVPHSTGSSVPRQRRFHATDCPVPPGGRESLPLDAAVRARGSQGRARMLLLHFYRSGVSFVEVIGEAR